MSMDNLCKKKLRIDLILIVLITFVTMGLYLCIINVIAPGVEKDKSVNVLFRVLLTGFFGQFALAGMGSSIVCLIRKDSFFSHGLSKKNIFPALILSLLCCLPELMFYVFRGEVYSWCPFIGVNYTYEVLHSAFPVNILSYLVIAMFWGFFEGFNYVIIADKINALHPSKFRYWDWGAAIMAISCILVHGMVGVTPENVIEMICTIILIYGILLVRKCTGNAWGCVLIFFVYWNALNRYYPILF